MLTSRLSRLEQIMAAAKLEALLLNPGPTLTYLTGLHFHLMERPTLLICRRGEQPQMILPELEAVKLSSIPFPMTVSMFGDDPATWQGVFDHALQPFKHKKVTFGVESSRLRFLELNYVQKALPRAEFIPADVAIGGLRLQKDAVEADCMRQAVRIAQKALQATLPFIKVGVTEQQIASELIIQLYRAGSSAELPFAPIVAAGENSANPHATPSSRKVKRGDLVLIDWGASYNDYFSDLTRTFAVGEIDPQLASFYEAVLSANKAGRAAGKPGLPAGAVDDAARTEITRAGFGKLFNHRTGHGLGMEAHEPPYMYGGNPLILQPGMTYTVEPGVYLEGLGGVRIEDDVLVTAEGSESLSDFSRELQIL